MTKTMIGFFMFGCGSADADFGASLTAELDGSVRFDAKVGVGGSGSSGRTGASGRASGGAANSAGATTGSGGFDTSCGPIPECIDVGTAIGPVMQCETDSDCCKGVPCDGHRCRMMGFQCANDDDCPCGWHCEQMSLPDSGPDAGHWCVRGAAP